MRGPRFLLLTGLLAFVVLPAGCGGGDGKGRFAFDASFSGLAPLGSTGGTYEGWAVTGGTPLSTGKFRIDDSVSPAAVVNAARTRTYGTVQEATFGPANTLLGESFPFITDATRFFVTLEPEGDDDGVPTGNVILEGTFTGDRAELAPSALVAGDLTQASAVATVATFTGSGSSPAGNGLWLLSTTMPPPGPVTLPEPLGSWAYEAFLDDGTSTWSLGRFRVLDRPDSDAATAPTRGDASVGPAAPGQDFLVGATGVGGSPVLDLASGSWRVEVTVEPEPDNASGPGPLLLLAGDVPSEAVDASGRSARDVDLDPLPGGLPRLDVLVGSDSLSFLGDPIGPLGPLQAGHYQAWAVVGGTPMSCGRFRVDPALDLVVSLDGLTIFGLPGGFILSAANTGLMGAFPDVQAATRVFFTVELQGDPLPAPSDHVILAGAMGGGGGELTVAGLRAFGGPGLADFRDVAGTCVLRSPTNDAPGVVPDDQRGAWFISHDDPRDPSLTLPPLPSGWVYEGWVVETGTGERWSTGRFQKADAPDLDANTWPGRGGARPGPSAPGQDFVTGNPGVAVPAMDLTGGLQVLVTLEPSPDTSPDPFWIGVLQGTTPAGAGTPFTLGPLLTGAPGELPSGVIRR